MKRISKRPLASGAALLPLVLLFNCQIAGAADPLPRAAPAKLGFSAEGLARIDRFYADEIAKDRVPGAVVAIARDGKLAYYKAIGYQDKAAGTPLKTDAIFQLASMTKVLTVVTALTLYEEGRLPLKSTLATYYPQFSSMQVGTIDSAGAIKTEPAKQPIFVQDLMRHTTGLTYGARGNTPIHKLYPPGSSGAAFAMSGPEFMDAMAKLPLLYHPGTTWDYGFSIDALGMVVEKITGKSLGGASGERVWSKLGMKDTAFSVPAEKRARMAQPLAVDPTSGKPQNIRGLREEVKFDCGGGCAFSTAADYIRFGQMLANGGSLNGVRVLSPKTVRLMTSDHLGKDIKNNVAGTEAGRAGYGFGLGVAVRTEPGVAATNGSVGDYSWNGANGTIFWVDPKEKLVVVVMAVSPGDIRKYYREQIAALVYGAMER
ncbi:MAG: beta-lactamase family protein [Betaproteobacteria bacterium]|nr:beta-lactamase family protein [Betaproteobacteria bacterium]